jgi:hypothetical protein
VSDHPWLPNHQRHVLFSLAHADDLIAATARIQHAYMSEGPFDVKDVEDGERIRATVTRIAPLPEALPRFAADALNQLRSALEHVLYAEIEFRLGRALTAQEAISIEMPAQTSSDGFLKWLQRPSRASLRPLRAGEDLCERLRDLQPYHRQQPDEHPLRRLVTHTNWAKHRTPAVAAVHLGAVRPEELVEGMVLSPASDRPIAIGDVLHRLNS